MPISDIKIIVTAFDQFQENILDTTRALKEFSAAFEAKPVEGATDE